MSKAHSLNCIIASWQPAPVFFILVSHRITMCNRIYLTWNSKFCSLLFSFDLPHQVSDWEFKVTTTNFKQLIFPRRRWHLFWSFPLKSLSDKIPLNSGFEFLLPVFFLNIIWNLSKEVNIGKPKNADYYPLYSLRPITLVLILVKLMEKLIFGNLILESYCHF
jgi:hypothetical protein